MKKNSLKLSNSTSIGTPNESISIEETSPTSIQFENRIVYRMNNQEFRSMNSIQRLDPHQSVGINSNITIHQYTK